MSPPCSYPIDLAKTNLGLDHNKGQVPVQKTKYLFIGNGRATKHLSYYFSQLGLSTKIWSRRDSSPLAESLTNIDRVIIGLRDDEIVNFYNLNKILKNYPCIHLSGRLTHSEIISAHPLMTFAETKYALETYKKIPFIVEKGRPGLNKIFPELPNQSFEISTENKNLYHALCSIAGNFPQILWQRVFNEFGQKLNIPHTVLEEYLKQALTNSMLNPDAALTGPLARGDHRTTSLHVDALTGSNLQPLYFSFINFYNSNKNTTRGPDGHPSI